MLRVFYVLWTTLTYPVLRWIRPHRMGAFTFVFDDQHQVLLVRQTYRDGWFLPGGGVNRKEHLEAAARRELYEETGIIPEGPMMLFGAYTYDNPRYTDHTAFYVLYDWNRKKRRSFEIAETRFFPLTSLPEDLSPAVTVRLEELTGARPRPPVWTGQPDLPVA